MSCIGCTFTHYPSCAIQNIVSSVDMDALLNNHQFKKIMFPVCHKNAQSINENKIIKNSSCDNCMLCEAICPFLDSHNTLNVDTEHVALSNLNRLNILIKNILPNALVATEVKAKGNAREKRVDLVIRKDKTIFLIKVLSDTDRYSFYYRSYEDIKNYYEARYKEYTIYFYILIPSWKNELAQSKGYNCKTINKIIQEIQEI